MVPSVGVTANAALVMCSHGVENDRAWFNLMSPDLIPQ